MAARGETNQNGLLLKDLRKQVTALEDDLRVRCEAVDEYREKLRAEYDAARAGERTAATYGSWLEERITQAAAAWVLACVFVRFCEDNRLIEDAWIAGPGERLRDAEERHEAYFREYPEKNDRHWLTAAFEHLATTNSTVLGLFDRQHNPLWELAPSYETVELLLKFWRSQSADGNIIYGFEDPELDTRFLGDLYQDLSEHARKKYALLQTPKFVEDFILDLTLEPAIREFGLSPIVEIHEADGSVRVLPAGIRAIDPACGSGHFLLGIFERVLKKWRSEAQGEDDWILIRRALESVHGCDKNPFAVAIARFRLLIAALKAAQIQLLSMAPEFPIHVAVGDSLLHGRGASGASENLFAPREQFFYQTEDVYRYTESCALLERGSYHVVVANPPYITVKDKAENAAYRNAYSACSGIYALSIPFGQRIFELAIRTSGSDRSAGYIGQITANSFMKREFGKELINWLHQKVDLTHVIDSSGAYIPGHGTPTIILVGRNRTARQSDPIRAVLGIRGEPSQPEDASNGHVWSAIVKQTSLPGSESQWISVHDSVRARWATQPWSLKGGGAAGVTASIESGSSARLSDVISRVGFFGMTHADDAMIAPQYIFDRDTEKNLHRPLAIGEDIREWAISNRNHIFFPYNDSHDLVNISDYPRHAHRLWRSKSELENRTTFNGTSYSESGRSWYEWHQIPKDIRASSLSISFAFVATHNHFALDRTGGTFTQSAPLIKLPKGATEDDHLGLLGAFNSSTACFWLKQVSHDKGNRGEGGGITSENWERFYEFTSTKLQTFPLPEQLPRALGRLLDSLAQDLASHEPRAVCSGNPAPTFSLLAEAQTSWMSVRSRMIALQEELDWEIYHSYGLLSERERSKTVTPELGIVPGINLGERAFEVVLARAQEAGEVETAWFERHRSSAASELPSQWPSWYRDIVQARIDIIEARPDLALIEKPEYKRRWSADLWQKKEKTALRAWLLNRCADRDLWFHMRDEYEQPRPLTAGQLTDELSKCSDSADILRVAKLYASHLKTPNLTLEQVLLDVMDLEHVPHLAVFRYKESGLRKHAQWQDIWELQREEDLTGFSLDIPIPPKYTTTDFAKVSYWSNRGKLDVPKERFISYPEASPDSDPTLLLGWAGWDHRDQAQALLNLINDRTEQSSWDTARLTPLIAGLAELMPWVHQWYGTQDDEWGGNAAEEFQAALDDLMAKHRLTVDDLSAWRPTKKQKKRKAAK